MTTNHWAAILTAAEIDAHHALTAQLDRSFAARQREFYASRTPGQLASLAHQAWMCNEGEQYQLARSYAALRELAA